MSNYYKKILGFGFFVTICASLFTINSMAQDLLTGSSVFIFKRPAVSGSSPNKSVYRKQKPLPLRKRQGKSKKETAASSTPISKETPDYKAALAANEQLGITLWRLRPERSGDTGARLLTMKDSAKDSSKMVAERVGLDTVFRMGEKVRISVESPRAGYLYIIDASFERTTAWAIRI